MCTGVLWRVCMRVRVSQCACVGVCDCFRVCDTAIMFGLFSGCFLLHSLFIITTFIIIIIIIRSSCMRPQRGTADAKSGSLFPTLGYGLVCMLCLPIPAYLVSAFPIQSFEACCQWAPLNAKVTTLLCLLTVHKYSILL